MTENSYNQFIGSILFCEFSLWSPWIHQCIPSQFPKTMRCASACQAFPAPVQKHHSFWRRPGDNCSELGIKAFLQRCFQRAWDGSGAIKATREKGNKELVKRQEITQIYTASFFISVPALFSTLFLCQNECHLPRGRSWPFPSTRWESGSFTSPADPAACVSFMNSSLSLSYEFLQSRMNSLNFSEGLPLSDVQCRSLQLIPDAEEWPDRLSTWVSWWLWCGDLGWTPQ